MLTPEQITWASVTGSRRVKRLPSHFTVVTEKLLIDQNIFNSLYGHGTDCRSILGSLGNYIDQHYSGRYFITFYNGFLPTPIVTEVAIIVAFENPAEAGFFSLQFSHLVAHYTKLLKEKII